MAYWWWLHSVVVWCSIAAAGASLKTAKVTVNEGTQKDELILDLIQGTFALLNPFLSEQQLRSVKLEHVHPLT